MAQKKVKQFYNELKDIKENYDFGFAFEDNQIPKVIEILQKTAHDSRKVLSRTIDFYDQIKNIKIELEAIIKKDTENFKKVQKNSFDELSQFNDEVQSLLPSTESKKKLDFDSFEKETNGGYEQLQQKVEDIKTELADLGNYYLFIELDSLLLNKPEDQGSLSEKVKDLQEKFEKLKEDLLEYEAGEESKVVYSLGKETFETKGENVSHDVYRVLKTAIADLKEQLKSLEEEDDNQKKQAQEELRKAELSKYKNDHKTFLTTEARSHIKGDDSEIKDPDRIAAVRKIVEEAKKEIDNAQNKEDAKKIYDIAKAKIKEIVQLEVNRQKEELSTYKDTQKKLLETEAYPQVLGGEIKDIKRKTEVLKLVQIAKKDIDKAQTTEQIQKIFNTAKGKIQEIVQQEVKFQAEKTRREQELKERIRREELRKEELRKEELRKEELRKEELRKEELRKEELRKEELRKEELRKEELRKEELRKEELRKEQERQDELRKQEEQRKQDELRKQEDAPKPQDMNDPQLDDSNQIISFTDTETRVTVSGKKKHLKEVAGIRVVPMQTPSLGTPVSESYDIVLVDTKGETIQPSGPVVVTAPTKGIVDKVYYVLGEMKESLPFVQNSNGTVSFGVTHFSVYAIFYKQAMNDSKSSDTSTPKCDDKVEQKSEPKEHMKQEQKRSEEAPKSNANQKEPKVTHGIARKMTPSRRATNLPRTNSLETSLLSVMMSILGVAGILSLVAYVVKRRR
ncbi:hypothetical protein [Streptococcus hillyeri]|uniref:hypothetical protein n=1 Tax=Streptococcus hillyeri TaxID=2282420 RepID=UPI001FE336FD|nr:hypothetical protein [Streptococcus hillyeri]